MGSTHRDNLKGACRDTLGRLRIDFCPRPRPREFFWDPSGVLLPFVYIRRSERGGSPQKLNYSGKQRSVLVYLPAVRLGPIPGEGGNRASAPYPHPTCHPARCQLPQAIFASSGA
jgi:hypothetical protein